MYSVHNGEEVNTDLVFSVKPAVDAPVAPASNFVLKKRIRPMHHQPSARRSSQYNRAGAFVFHSWFGVESAVEIPRRVLEQARQQPGPLGRDVLAAADFFWQAA